MALSDPSRLANVTLPTTFPQGQFRGPYSGKSVKARILAFLLDNVDHIVVTADLKRAAQNPETGVVPENWHQRLSELRTDDGYTILTHRDRADLRSGQYVMSSAEKRVSAGTRVLPTPETWIAILARSENTCEWTEGGHVCRLREGEIDPVGGGTVRLTADHMTPHSINSVTDTTDPGQWRALCGRHQVMKKNYWDNATGKINTIAVLQAFPTTEKRKALEFLLEFFGHRLAD
jgi:hypothetical protein